MTANPKTIRGQDVWVDKIYSLMDAVDSYITTPEREVDKPFLLAVEDVFTITGRVDADNPNGALRLYESVGFQKVYTSIKFLRNV